MKQVWPAQRKQQAESVSCVRSRRWDCKWAFYTTGFSGLCTEHALRVIRRKKAEVPQRYAGRNESMQTTKESLGSGVHFLPGITSSPTTFPPHQHSQPEQKQHVLPLQTRFPHCSRRRAWSLRWDPGWRWGRSPVWLEWRKQMGQRHGVHLPSTRKPPRLDTVPLW